jgi:hypothetical protein
VEWECKVGDRQCLRVEDWEFRVDLQEAEEREGVEQEEAGQVEDWIDK